MPNSTRSQQRNRTRPHAKPPTALPTCHPQHNRPPLLVPNQIRRLPTETNSSLRRRTCTNDDNPKVPESAGRGVLRTTAEAKGRGAVGVHDRAEGHIVREAERDGVLW